MFLDSDDYLELDAIEFLVALSNLYPKINIFGGGYRLYQTKDKKEFEIYSRSFDIKARNIFIDQIQMMILNMGNNMIRKQILQAYGGFNISLNYAEDWELLLNICRFEKVVSEKKLVLNIYRHHDNSSFIKIQESVIKVVINMLATLLNEKNKNYSSTENAITELHKRLVMAYSRKNDKLKAFNFYVSVLKRNYSAIFSDTFFIRELIYLFLPAKILITARAVQLKLISKENNKV